MKKSIGDTEKMKVELKEKRLSKTWKRLIRRLIQKTKPDMIDGSEIYYINISNNSR